MKLASFIEDVRENGYWLLLSEVVDTAYLRGT
jgi:hypothetical protein